LKSTFGWSLSNLAALLRHQLFVYRDLFDWLNKPFEAPPVLQGIHDAQLGFDFGGCHTKNEAGFGEHITAITTILTGQRRSENEPKVDFCPIPSTSLHVSGVILSRKSALCVNVSCRLVP